MILTLTLAFCGFVIIIAGILTLKGMMKVNDYKVKPYDTTIHSDQLLKIVRELAAYKTNFTYYPIKTASNEIEFKDQTNNNLILKVSNVSCYSDISGIKNHQGYLYSIIKDYVVLKSYTSLDECMRDYQQNYCLFVKKIKIADRLKSLQEDF
jgi:hypothetical protein